MTLAPEVHTKHPWWHQFNRFLDKWPYERCGIVTVDMEVIELPNRHENPSEHFRIAHADIREALPGAPGYWGIWHTHIGDSSADPSDTDRERLPKHARGYVIHTSSGTLTTYNRNRVLTRKQL